MEPMTSHHPHIVLYGKPGCHLCDEARELLEDLAATPDRFMLFDLDEIDIRRDETIFAAYRYRIPVITVDGAIVAEGIMDNGTARLALEHTLALPTKPA